MQSLERRAQPLGQALGRGAGQHRTVPFGEGEVQQSLRETFHAQLMLALYRTGRRGEALDLYLGLHRRLVARLGMEPMPMIQRLHHSILSGSPASEAHLLPAR